MRLVPVAIFVSFSLVASACGGSDSEPEKSRNFTEASDVFAALVDRLEDEDKVLHATVTSTQSDGPDESTFEFWVDEARDVARKDENLANVLPKDRKVVIVDGQAYAYVGNSEPVQWEAPSCEGITSPATSLLLRCERVESRAELVESGTGTLRIETTGSYGPDIANKSWTIALTIDEGSLMPLSSESNLWGLLNGEPYEINESQIYTTEFVEREDLPAGFFELE